MNPASRTPKRRGPQVPPGRRRGAIRAAAAAALARGAMDDARRRPRDGGGPMLPGPPLRTRARSTLDVSPGLLPLRVVHAVALSAAAVLHGRLPELDRMEVGARRVQMPECATTLLDLVHERAGLLVRRRFAERQ